MKEMRVILPSIERPKKLPVVLNQNEIRQLLRTPKLLKHRLVLAMLYGCGLRSFELRNLQRRDLDFDRKMLHVRQGNNPGCQKLHLSYNSCRNRHCPKCQGHKKEEWIQAREADLLKVSYFHVVFTLPCELNRLCLYRPK